MSICNQKRSIPLSILLFQLTIVQSFFAAFYELAAGFGHQFFADDAKHVPECLDIFGGESFFDALADDMDIVEDNTVLLTVAFCRLYAVFAFVVLALCADYISFFFEFFQPVRGVRSGQFGVL